MFRKAVSTAMLTLVLASTLALSASAVPIDVVLEVWAIEYTLSTQFGTDHDGNMNVLDPAEDGDVIEGDEPDGPIKDEGGNSYGTN